MNIRRLALLLAPDLRAVQTHIDTALAELETLEFLTSDDVSGAVRELRAARRLLSHP